MYKKALEVLNLFSENGFLAYIVGGYPRDNLLGVKTQDIDICTNASPKEIMEIFKTDKLSDISYGSVKVIYKNVKFDVTTFRKDIKYEDNRKPVKIKYIDDLKKDLLRRDFTINTICIDKDGKYIDLLDGNKDIEKKLIKMVGNPRYRIKEDILRSLRAIRFATVLNFEIDNDTKNYIIKYKGLLKKLSSSRKKEELNKIFSSVNRSRGRELLVLYGLDKELGLDNLKDIVLCDDLVGIWSQLKLSCDYPFTKLEKDSIKKIQEMLKIDMDSYAIYKYGLYISAVVGSIKGISYKAINFLYQNLGIYSQKDINVSAMEIVKYLNKEPGNYLSVIYKDLEEKIINQELENEKDELLKYIGDNYGNI